MKPANYIALFTLLMVSIFTTFGAPASPPNLIIILTDDQGYHDVGFNGCRDIPTPNLDSIASNGVHFTSGYVPSPLSSPSRAGLLTGRYPERFGYEHDPELPANNPVTGLPLSETTLADTLRRAGYATGFIGKWHLGRNPAMLPLRRGFDEFFGFLGAGHLYLPEEFTKPGPGPLKSDYDTWEQWLIRNDKPVQITNYLTDELSGEAVRFIARHQARPFFLVLSYNAPYGPLQATDKYLSRFPKILGTNRRTYAAMLSAVDDGVGTILTELRQDALAEQTMVVYLSASGGALDVNSSDNYPLRGSKDYPWEGGWRVPFAMQWPGHLPKGLTYNRPVLSLDIYATITALAKVPGKPGNPLDGVNLVPYLTGRKTGAPHDKIYLRMPNRGAYAIRSGDYKLVVPARDQPAELYDLSTDISECRNLAETKPAVLKQLAKEQSAWSRQMKFPAPPGTTEENAPQPIDTEADR